MPRNPTRTVCYFDGACPRNQFGTKGPMKAAYVVGDTEMVRDLPDLTTPRGSLRSNNIAEYQALIFLLEHLRQQGTRDGGRGRCLINGDSELVIRQMRGEYRVKQPHLQRLHAEAIRLATGLDLEFRWVPREQNRAGFLLEPRRSKRSEATREN